MAPTNVNGHIVWEALGPASPLWWKDSGWEGALLSGPWQISPGTMLWGGRMGWEPTHHPSSSADKGEAVGVSPGGILEAKTEAYSHLMFLSWRREMPFLCTFSKPEPINLLSLH